MDGFAKQLIETLDTPHHARAMEVLEGLGDLVIDPMIETLKDDKCPPVISLLLAELLAKRPILPEWLTNNLIKVPKSRQVWFVYALSKCDPANVSLLQLEYITYGFSDLEDEARDIAYLAVFKLDPSDPFKIIEKALDSYSPREKQEVAKLIRDNRVPFAQKKVSP